MPQLVYYIEHWSTSILHFFFYINIHLQIFISKQMYLLRCFAAMACWTIHFAQDDFKKNNHWNILGIWTLYDHEAYFHLRNSYHAHTHEHYNRPAMLVVLNSSALDKALVVRKFLSKIPMFFGKTDGHQEQYWMCSLNSSFTLSSAYDLLNY